MFDFVHEKKRFVQIVLVLIIITFAFFGLDTFNQVNKADVIATVDGEKITQQAFEQDLRQQQERMRESMQGNFDPAMLDNPEAKRTILNNLIDQRLLIMQARAVGLKISDKQLAETIAGIEAFQKEGRFDKALYASILTGQGRAIPAFEAEMAQSLNMRQLIGSYLQNGYASTVAAEKIIRLNEQKRVVAIAHIPLDSFLKKVKVTDADIKKYYESNMHEFKVDEQLRVEYVTFSAADLQSQISVTEEEVKKYYDEHAAEFGTQEQRQAAHILISAAAQASGSEKDAAKLKAENILQQVKQSPQAFANLAKQHSHDTGSAAVGGDLGMIARGAMVPPFEEAVYKLKVGEISELVQTDFGFHIIKLVAIEPAKIKPYSEVKNDIMQKMRAQKSSDTYADLAGKFSDIVYEQSDTLKAAADLVKMPVRQSSWLSKRQVSLPIWTDKALQAVFADDVVKNKRNSTAVEIAPNTLLAARLLELKPASIRALAEVEVEIRQKLLRTQAQEMLQKQGQETLAQLQRGEKADVAWQPRLTVTREQHTGMDRELAQLVFKANVSKLPAYTAVVDGRGAYVLARIEAVKEPAEISKNVRDGYMQQLRRTTGQQLLQLYLDDIRGKASITKKEFTLSEGG